MPSSKYTDDTAQIYFGNNDPRPSKERVESFIKENMGYERADGSAQWSKGVGELLEYGMDAFEESQQAFTAVDPSEVEELRDRVEELEAENEQLRAATPPEPDDPERQQLRWECRVLEVLNRDENTTTRGEPAWIGYDVLTAEIGMNPETVVSVIRSLRQHGRIEQHNQQKKIRAVTGFEDYAEGAGFDPDVIREENQ